MTSEVLYKRELRTEMTHLKSGEIVITDAPTDNHGKGAYFSPTDLVASALASCMLTTMGIKANQMGLDIDGTDAKVLKVMASEPRRISEVQVQVTFPAKDYSEKDRNIMEHTALHCPVAKSLHPDLIQNVQFNWQ